MEHYNPGASMKKSVLIGCLTLCAFQLKAMDSRFHPRVIQTNYVTKLPDGPKLMLSNYNRENPLNEEDINKILKVAADKLSIYAIDLKDSNLKTIPLSLTAFRDLKELDLSNNNLTNVSIILKMIGQLDSLDLYDNSNLKLTAQDMLLFKEQLESRVKWEGLRTGLNCKQPWYRFARCCLTEEQKNTLGEYQKEFGDKFKIVFEY